MAQRVDSYRVELRGLKEWEPYLKKHSGLPGPRANLELVQAVGEEADPDRLWRLSASSDEFLALCGTAGLGRVALMEPETVMTWLRELASDPRWRVREGVAMALQHIGRENMPRLLADMQEWSEGEPYVQRAAAAGLCEPVLLKHSEHAVQVMAILDRITDSLATAEHRRSDGFRVLRQALGYCWSVAAAAAPENARPYLEKWLRSRDRDVAWVMKSNLDKARMADLAVELSAPRPAPRARPAPKAKPKPKSIAKPKAKRKLKTKPRK
jgi:HEAT repeat protein